MSAKKKILLSVLVTLLVLVIIGLSIAIAIVAGVANVGSSMRVSYVANNVACTITPSAVTVNNEKGVIGIMVNPSQIVVKATDSANDVGEDGLKDHDAGHIEFSEATIDAGWKVIYTFNVRNDASDGGSSIVANCKFDEIDFVENNVIVKVGETEDTAQDVDETYSFTTGNIAPQKDKSIVVVISIRNYSFKVNLKMNNIITVYQ